MRCRLAWVIAPESQHRPFQLQISDLASCYWLIETETLKKFDIQESGFAIEVEVISKAIKYSLDIFEVPIKYHGRTYEDGKKIKLKDGILILIKIFQYSYFFNNFIKKIKFLKI